MRRTTALLLILGWAAFFAGLGRTAIADSDEAFYAEAGREMLTSGDWLTPHYGGQPRFQKPVLTYWLIAAGYRLAGVNEVTARVWSALAGLGLALLTAAAGRRWYDEETARTAGAIVATGFGYFSMARLSLPDLPLAFFVSAAVYAAIVAALDSTAKRRAWWLLAGATTGLGLLTKGPIALVLVVLVVVPLAWRERASLKAGWTGPAVAVAAALAVAGPWYGAMTAVHGLSYLQGFLVGDNVERFATTRFNDPRPWWFYLSILAGGVLPWTLLAMCGLIPALRARRGGIAAATWRFAWWALGPFLFFTASIGKQPRYILPVLPPLALLVARGITAVIRSTPGSAARWLLRLAGTLTSVVLGVLAWLLWRAMPVVVNVEPRLVLVGVALVAAGAVTVAAASAMRSPSHIPLGTALAGALTLLGLTYGLSPAGHDAVQEVARHVLAQRASEERVATYHVLVRNLVYYTRLPTIDLTSADDLRAFLSSRDRVLCVLRARDLDAARAAAPSARVLWQALYLDASPVRLRPLFAKNPGKALEPIVLISNQ